MLLVVHWVVALSGSSSHRDRVFYIRRYLALTTTVTAPWLLILWPPHYSLLGVLSIFLPLNVPGLPTGSLIWPGTEEDEAWVTEFLAYAHSGGKADIWLHGGCSESSSNQSCPLVSRARTSSSLLHESFLRKNPGLASGRASCSGVQHILQTSECSSQKPPYSLRKPMEVSQA